MSKENKNTYVRRDERQCSHIDNRIVSSVQDSTKAMATTNRDSGHDLQEVSTKDSTLTKENMIMISTEDLCSLKDGIAENGIKYVLCRLCSYLFDKISSIFSCSEKHIEIEHTELCNENHEERDKWEQTSQKCRKQKMENNSNNRPLTKVQDAEKDSDSSRNQSSNGSNVTAINMPLNCKNIDNCISHTVLKQPTNISTEEHSFNKTQFPINISQDTKSCANERNNVIQNKFPKSYTRKQGSNFSANKEIAQIFGQKFTSSDNVHSSSSIPGSFAFVKYRKSKQTNSFCNGENNKFSNNSLIRTWLKKNETVRTREQSIKLSPTNENRKLTFDKEKNEKHTEQRNKKETQEENRSFRRHDPIKCKSHYSRIPVKNKKSKQDNPKYIDRSTQTDSAFLTDNDVGIVSVRTEEPRQQFHRSATYKPQDRDMTRELNYMAENETSEDRLLSVAYQLISSYCTSSSSTDLNFEQYTSASLDTQITAEQWSTEFLNTLNSIRTPTRPPPGFPEIPQNPPLIFTPYVYNVEHVTLSFSEDNYYPNSHDQQPRRPMQPAPPRRRHK